MTEYEIIKEIRKDVHKTNADSIIWFFQSFCESASMKTCENCMRLNKCINVYIKRNPNE